MRNGSEEPVRERILAAATTAFSEHGYAQAGVKEICAQACVTTGALYNHFGGKSALYREVRARAEVRLLAGMVDAARGAVPGAKAVRAALLAAWDLAQAEGIARLFMQPAPQIGDTDLADFLYALWPWGPGAIGRVLLAAWRGALQESLTNPGPDTRLVLDGILRGLAGDLG